MLCIFIHVYMYMSNPNYRAGRQNKVCCWRDHLDLSNSHIGRYFLDKVLNTRRKASTAASCHDKISSFFTSERSSFVFACIHSLSIRISFCAEGTHRISPVVDIHAQLSHQSWAWDPKDAFLCFAMVWGTEWSWRTWCLNASSSLLVFFPSAACAQWQTSSAQSCCIARSHSDSVACRKSDKPSGDALVYHTIQWSAAEK